MNFIKGTGPGLFAFFVSCIGGVAFSQGVSFARLNSYGHINDTINFHALLISGIGIALMFAGWSLESTLKRIDKLEETIKQLKSNRAI